MSNENVCHQYERKLDTFDEDLAEFHELNIRWKKLETLRVNDFKFRPLEDNEFKEAKKFIERYEWLGKVSNYPTHLFGAFWNGILAGVVVMDMPAAFSKMLGANTRKMERLISRGATASWTPKNLGSALVMYSVRWMVKNTPYRLFTAYSDPEALELGTIYQACNFYYLGNNFGTKIQYLYNGRWVSDRSLRSRSAYKRYAKALGIEWEANWQQRDRILWANMPQITAKMLKAYAKGYMETLKSRKPVLKHKYAYVLGATKAETKSLRTIFTGRNKVYAYPKERGK